jgi:hypothetical protein
MFTERTTPTSIDANDPTNNVSTNAPAIQLPPMEEPKADVGTGKPNFSTGAIVAMSAIFVVGGVAALIAILNYRTKILRDAREHQQERIQGTPSGDPIVPLTPPVVDADDRTPIIADAVPMPLPPERTLEADAVLELSTAAAHLSATAAAAHAHLSRKTRPSYKDQVRGIEAPGQIIYCMPFSSTEPKRNDEQDQNQNHQQDYHQEEQRQNDQRQVDQSPLVSHLQQQLHRDPPGVVNWVHQQDSSD